MASYALKTYAKDNGGRVSLLVLLFLLAIYVFITAGFPFFDIICVDGPLFPVRYHACGPRFHVDQLADVPVRSLRGVILEECADDHYRRYLTGREYLSETERGDESYGDEYISLDVESQEETDG